MDAPTNTSFDENRFSFNAPSVENCELRFYLTKIETNKRTRLKQYEVDCVPLKYNEISLDYKLSIGDEYKIEYTVSKQFVNFDKRIISGQFEGTVSIDLGDGWIVLITFGCLAAVLIPAILLFIFFKRREKNLKKG